MYCSRCGNEVKENENFCTKCGYNVAGNAEPPMNNGDARSFYNSNNYDQQQYAPNQEQGYYQYPYGQPAVVPVSGTATVAKAFMILGTVLMALGTVLIGLAWCLPMTIHYCNCLKTGRPVGTGFKICCMLFVSFIGGILMLCDSSR